MKVLLPALLLVQGAVSCTAPSHNPTQAAVAAHIKQNTNYPASYEAVKWGKARPWRQQDVDIGKAASYLMEGYRERRAGQSLSQHLIDMRGLNRVPEKDLAELAKVIKPLLAFLKHREDSLMALYEQAKASTDTTRLGTVVVHAYRTKNKRGALRLDSATFLVLNNGKVERQPF